jgi:hypothetical protein
MMTSFLAYKRISSNPSSFNSGKITYTIVCCCCCCYDREEEEEAEESVTNLIVISVDISHHPTAIRINSESFCQLLT